MVRKGASVVAPIQVHWGSLPPSMTTWEEEIDLRRHYPNCPAWGQAGFRGGGNVSNRGKRRGIVGRQATGPASG